MRTWILAFSLVLLAGCSGRTPPVPTVMVGETEVPVVLSTHCWQNQCADYPPPEEQLAESGYPVVTADKNTDPISVRFNSTPPSGFTLAPWQNRKPDPLDPVRGRNMELGAAFVPGVHTFSVTAHWKQGTVTHLFQIQVPGSAPADRP